MNTNKTINCTVKSCKYNNSNDCSCNLDAINVVPIKNNQTNQKDESICGSYKHE